jgi:ribosomal protein L15E
LCQDSIATDNLKGFKVLESYWVQTEGLSYYYVKAIPMENNNQSDDFQVMVTYIIKNSNEYLEFNDHNYALS